MKTISLVSKVEKTNSGRTVILTWVKGQEHAGHWETDFFDLKTGNILGNCVNEALNQVMYKLHDMYKKGTLTQNTAEKIEVEVIIEE
jgi:hypothetical protein